MIRLSKCKTKFLAYNYFAEVDIVLDKKAEFTGLEIANLIVNKGLLEVNPIEELKYLYSSFQSEPRRVFFEQIKEHELYKSFVENNLFVGRRK